MKHIIILSALAYIGFISGELGYGIDTWQYWLITMPFGALVVIILDKIL